MVKLVSIWMFMSVVRYTNYSNTVILILLH